MHRWIHRTALIAAALVVAFSISGASAEEEDGLIMGAGMVPCARFAEEYRRDPQHIENLFFYWAQGYMTGLNMVEGALKRPLRDLKGWPIDQQQSELRLFCNDKPLVPYLAAVQSLFTKLPVSKWQPPQ